MASKRIEVRGLVMIFVLMMFSEAKAQSNCMNVIISMASCLNYVTGSSKTPSPSCCSSLANVVQNQPRCLCTVINGGGSQLGININNTLALQLPSACNVKTPPVSRCNEANGPAMSPVGSPETSPGPDGSVDGTSDSPTTPAVTGSKATPGTATPSSGNITKKNLNLVGLVLLLVAYVSNLSTF